MKERIARLRAAHPGLDRLLSTWEHYGAHQGNQQAGGVTYFAFLSFFPILALAFFVVGWIAKVYPEARDDLLEAIGQVLPGMIGDGPGELSLSVVQENAATVGLIGLVGVLYAGLGWLSSIREALLVLFELPTREQPNLVMGKLRDLISLAVLGAVLLLSVSVSGFVAGFSRELLDLVGLGAELSWALKALTWVLGLAASTVLFWALFRILAAPDLTGRELLQGALLGAVGFELLKRLSGVLMASTKDQEAFQVFGITLILLVWINYFSRLVLLAAAFAHTAPGAVERRRLAEEAAHRVEGPRIDLAAAVAAGAAPVPEERDGRGPVFAAGAATMLAAVALARRFVRR